MPDENYLSAAEARDGRGRLVWLAEIDESVGPPYGPRHGNMTLNAVLVEIARAIIEEMDRK